MNRLLTAILACLLAAAGARAAQPTYPDFKEGNIYYIVTDSAARTLKVTNDGFIDGKAYPDTAYDIPATVTHSGIAYTVTAIGEYAFANCGTVARVGLPATVTAIREAAFYNATALKAMQLPAAVDTIGSSAFYNTTALKTLSVPQGVRFIGDHAFGLSGITAFAVPPAIKTLEPHVLEATAITEITIPAAVDSIGGFAFYECKKLAAVTIQGRAMSMGEAAFMGCDALKTVDITHADDWCRFRFQDNNANPLCNGGEPTLRAGGATVTEVTVPDDVAALSPYAFMNYKKLQAATIPAGCAYVGDQAFYGCSALRTLNLYGTKTYKRMCFYNDRALETVNVADIAQWCASSFENGWSIPTRYSRSISLNGVRVADLVVPEGVETICDRAFREVALASVSLPSTLRTIGSEALSTCTGITLVKCAATTPPQGGQFADDVCADAKLQVPAQSVDAYRAADGWKNFNSIKSLGADSIDNDADDQIEAVYTPAGLRLDAPRHGLNIVRHRSGRVSKVIIK